MTLDESFPETLRNYVLNATSPEDLLLTKLREETHAQTTRPQMLTGPVEGKFLEILVKISGAKNCLEVGTFTGYSALYIASGLPAGGKLKTCEVRKEHAEMAQEFFNQSAVGNKHFMRS